MISCCGEHPLKTADEHLLAACDVLAADPASYVDPNGRVFSVDGQICRLIAPGYVKSARMLFERGIVERLCSQGLLVETAIACDTADRLVLRHRRISFPSYCVEWPFLLLKRAAVATLRLGLELNREGFYLQDAHPWNIFFEGTRPVFIDFTSIVPTDDRTLWPAYQQFCQFFLFPLYLHSCGSGPIARALLRDYLQGVSCRQFVKLVPLGFKLSHPQVYLTRILPEMLGQLAGRSDTASALIANRSQQACSRSTNRDSMRTRLLEGLLQEVEGIELPRRSTRWTRYYEDEAKALEIKRGLVQEVLGRVRPASVLDVGANTGEFSIMAARAGATVTALESDEECVDLLASQAEREQLPILPLVMDFSNPTPAFGWAARQFPSASGRVRSEMVMALALIHHLVFHQRQNFERIVEGLAEFTDRWLLIEFVDRDDSYIVRWSPDPARFGWYAREAFEACLRGRFSHVQCLGSVTGTRHLYLCER